MERVRTLTPADKPAVRALWDKRFDDSLPFRDWFFAERFRPETSACLEIDGRIVSVIQGDPMRLRLRNAEMNALMISGVSTEPGFERRGYMHRVMAEIMQLARRHGCPVVFDKPQSLPTFFSLGHLPCSDTLHFVSASDAPAPAFDELSDAPSLLACYEAATARYSNYVVRSPDDMVRKLRDYASDGGRVLSVRDGNTVLAYAAVFLTDEGYFAEEALARTPEALRRLLSLLPRGSRAKLPPDAGVPGETRPQNVLGAADVAYVLGATLGDARYVFQVSDPVVPENNGVFDGLGRRTNRTPDRAIPAGELLQMLSGYRSLDAAHPALPCFCVDEY